MRRRGAGGTLGRSGGEPGWHPTSPANPSTGSGATLISLKVSQSRFSRVSFRTKSVNSFLILVAKKDKLADLWGEVTFAKRRYKHFL